MKLTFYGAAREVTGSCTLVETGQTRVLVDCGIFQGSRFADAKNYADFAFDPADIDAVAVTHGHLDHTGRLPKLIRDGFRGNAYMTVATKAIAAIVLEDSMHVMGEDAKREGRPPLYDERDVGLTLGKIIGLPYRQPVTVGDVTLRFFDAGHIFGSAFIEVSEHNGPTVVFSGDIGNKNVPIIRETDPIERADAVVVESTYGNRIHEGARERERELKDAIIGTVTRGGVLLIPAFAVERTQQVLYEIDRMIESKKIPSVDVYLDSPMAIKIADVMKTYPEYYDTEALHLVSTGDDLFSFPSLSLTETRDESKAINTAPSPKVIIAGSGMMNGGRILHHLIRYLGDPKATVLIIGFQAHGTLGQKLYNGQKRVRIFGEDIRVRAEVKAIGAYSAHADQKKLVEWVGSPARMPRLALCTHGEEESAVALATSLSDKLGIKAEAPRNGESFEI